MCPSRAATPGRPYNKIRQQRRILRRAAPRLLKPVLLVIVAMLFLMMSPVSHAQDNGDLQPITPDNLEKIELLTSFEVPDVAFNSLRWSPNARQFAVSSGGALYVFDIENLGDAPLRTDLYRYESGFAFSPDGRLIAIAREDDIRLIDITTREVDRLIPTGSPVGTLRFSPQGDVIAGVDTEVDDPLNLGLIRLWDVETGEQTGSVGYPYSLPDYFNVPFVFGEDQLLTGLIAVNGWDYRDTANYRDPALLSREEYFEIALSIRYTPEDTTRYSWVLFRDGDHYALWLTGADGEAIFATQTEGHQPVIAGESGEGHDEDGIPQMLDGYTRMDRREMIGVLSDLQSAMFDAPTGTIMILSMQEAGTSLPRYRYDEAADTLTDMQTGTAYTLAQAFGAARYETVEGEPPVLSIYYAVEEGRLPDELLGDIAVAELAVSPDRRYLAVSGVNRDRRDETRLRVIDLHSRDVVGSISDPALFPENFTFNADATLLAGLSESGGNRPTVHIWDIRTGNLLITFNEPMLYNIAFSPDGRYLVLYGRYIQVWGIP